MSSNKLQNIAKKFIDQNFLLSVAESCTGGLLAKKITDESGSSAWFDCGFITYSNEAKIRMLGVNKESIAEFGAVSLEIAQEMAIGVQKNSRAIFSISPTFQAERICLLPSGFSFNPFSKSLI